MQNNEKTLKKKKKNQNKKQKKPTIWKKRVVERAWREEKPIPKRKKHLSPKKKKKKQETYVICYTSIYDLMSLTTRERMIREGSRGNSILACRTNTTWHHTVGWTVQQFLSLINNPTYKSTPHRVPNPSQYSQKILTNLRCVAFHSLLILWRSSLSFSRYFQILFFSLDLFCLSMTSR